MQVVVEFENPFPTNEFCLGINANVLTMTRSGEDIGLYTTSEVIANKYPSKEMDQQFFRDAILTFDGHSFRAISIGWRPSNRKIRITGAIDNTARSSLIVKFSELNDTYRPE